MKPLINCAAGKSSFAGFLFLAIEFSIFAACPGIIIIKFGQNTYSVLQQTRTLNQALKKPGFLFFRQICAVVKTCYRQKL
jgi:hypothetical protein